MAEYIKREDVIQMLARAIASGEGYTWDWIDNDDMRSLYIRLATSYCRDVPSINIDNGAILLSKEAYSDLCLRASGAGRDERMRKMIKEHICETITTSNGVNCEVRNGELVRCKDCKWRGKAGCAFLIVDESDKPKDDDFCSYGERKEQEDE